METSMQLGDILTLEEGAGATLRCVRRALLRTDGVVGLEVCELEDERGALVGVYATGDLVDGERWLLSGVTWNIATPEAPLTLVLCGLTFRRRSACEVTFEVRCLPEAPPTRWLPEAAPVPLGLYGGAGAARCLLFLGLHSALVGRALPPGAVLLLTPPAP